VSLELFDNGAPFLLMQDYSVEASAFDQSRDLDLGRCIAAVDNKNLIACSWRSFRRRRGVGRRGSRESKVLVPVGNLVRLVCNGESGILLPHERDLQSGLVGAGPIVPVADLVGS
jgi:hypothetical protein